MMPHKVFEEEKFFESAKNLRTRFEIGASNSLFLSNAEQKNVPMDGVSIFIEQSWGVIRSQKELNLPD